MLVPYTAERIIMTLETRSIQLAKAPIKAKDLIISKMATKMANPGLAPKKSKIILMPANKSIKPKSFLDIKG